MKKVQKLHLSKAWSIQRNFFIEENINEENCDLEFASSSLLSLSNNTANICIELTWNPPGDLNGQYEIDLYQLVDHFDAKKKTIVKKPDLNQTVFHFKSKDRHTIVKKLEELCK